MSVCPCLLNRSIESCRWSVFKKYLLHVAGVQAVLSRQASDKETSNKANEANGDTAEPCHSNLDKRLNRRHLFKRNITVAEIPDSTDEIRRLRTSSGGARFKCPSTSDSSAFQTIALVRLFPFLEILALLDYWCELDENCFFRFRVPWLVRAHWWSMNWIKAGLKLKTDSC